MAILVYVLWPFGIYIVDIWYIYCGHLVDFVAIWYILWLFGIFVLVLVCCTKKNLATPDSGSVRVWALKKSLEKM
jgi:hypothetical protein